MYVKSRILRSSWQHARLDQWLDRFLYTEKVTGSNPVSSIFFALLCLYRPSPGHGLSLGPIGRSIGPIVTEMYVANRLDLWLFSWFC